MRRRILLSLAGLLVTLVSLELLLRALPVSTATLTGYHFDRDLLTYPTGHEWTVSTGWDLRNPQRLRSNNWGYASPRDFLSDRSAIALIGDSYVEASMLDASHRPAAQLETQLGTSRPVYGMGSPGTALLDYAQRVRFAAEKFQVRDFVIWLEVGDVRQALCGSGNVQSRCLDPRTLEPRIERLPDPSWLKRVARHSALAQYFAGQLKFRSATFLAALLSRSTPDDPIRRATPAVGTVGSGAAPDDIRHARRVVDAVLNRFFEVAGPYLVGKTVFIVDGDRGGTQRVNNESLMQRQYLIDGLRGRGFQVVDLEPIYAEHAAGSPLSLEVGPYDRHLNALGVQLVMGQAARSLAP